MGAIGGLLGTAGGANGTGFAAPKTIDVQQGTTVGNVQGAQAGTANSMQNQQALLKALQTQNGLGNQNQVFQGLQGTAGQYQNIANGTGPNPAQAMLNQQTGQNVANQAALMAGQRGAGANVGLMARQAAQQGAATQQQAVGQGATMEAQQRLNALAGLTGVQGQQAGLANQMAGQQIGQVNTNAQTQLVNQQMMQNALAGINSANVTNQGNVNAANAGLASINMQGQQALLGGAMKGMGGASTMPGGSGGGAPGAASGGAAAGAAYGGEIKYAEDGETEAPWQSEAGANQSMAAPAAPQEAPWQAEAGANQSMPAANQSMPAAAPPASPPTGPQSSFGQFLQSSAPDKPKDVALPFNPSQRGYGSAELEAGTQALVGSGVNNFKNAMSQAESSGSMAAMAAAGGGLADSGGHVKAKSPEQKAVASGDDYSNDKIPARLSEGEIVLPRSVTMAEDPIRAASDFVAKTLAERKSIPKKNFAAGTPDGPIGQNSDDYNALPDATPEQVADANQTEAAQASPQMDVAQASPSQNSQMPAMEKTFNMPATGAPGPAQTPNPLSPEGRIADQMKFEQDLAAGKIQPKTVQDLFAEKSTLGKIGTLFGLIVSGAGAGLTHTSNNVMDMMNQQIQNDFEKQKADKANARNFITMQDAHDTHLASMSSNQQDLLNKQILTLQDAGIDTTEPQWVDYIKQRQQDIWGGTAALAKGRSVVAHAMGQMAENSGNPTAVAAVQQVKNDFDQRNANDVKRASAADAATLADVRDKQQAQRSSGPINNTALEDAIIKGERVHGKPVKGAIAPGDAQAVRQEAKDMGVLHNVYNNYVDTFNKLKAMPRGGQSLAGTISAGLGHGDKASAAQGLLNAFKGASERDRDKLLSQFQKISGFDDDTIDKMFPGLNDLGDEDKMRSAFEGGNNIFTNKQKETLKVLPTYNKRVPDVYRDLPIKNYDDLPQAAPQQAPSKNGANKDDDRPWYERFGLAEKVK